MKTIFMKVKLLLAQLTESDLVRLCDLTDCSPPGFSVHELLQARILEWVAIPSPGDLPHPGIKPGSSALQPDALLSELPGKETQNGKG